MKAHGSQSHGLVLNHPTWEEERMQRGRVGGLREMFVRLHLVFVVSVSFVRGNRGNRGLRHLFSDALAGC